MPFGCVLLLGRVALGFHLFRRAQLPEEIQQLEGLDLDVGLETSGGGSHYPDLSLGRVWTHSKHLAIRAEFLRVSVFTWSVALFS